MTITELKSYGVAPIEHTATNLSHKYKYDKNDLDLQANLFADMLLMDAKAFVYQYWEHEKKGYNEMEIIRALSQIFVVPQVAVWRRIRELGLKTEDENVSRRTNSTVEEIA